MGDDNAKRRLRTNELSYLSPFERRLNRTLWGLTWLAVLYSIAQHVLLANIPELFPGGARLGDLIYDLAIAYVGAFVFYLLVVRIPLRRDRENVYQHLEPLMTRIVQEADELMGTLHQAAGFESHRPNTLANVIETCAKIEPETPTSQRLVAFSTNPIRPPVRDAVQYHMERARRVNRAILDLSTYVSSDVISLVNRIESDGYFTIFESVYPLYRDGILVNESMSFLDRPLFNYLLLVDRIDAYRRDFLPQPTPRPEYLVPIGGDSDEVPLSRLSMPPGPEETPPELEDQATDADK